MTRRELTKADLPGFDSEAISLLLWAQEQGARIKVSKRQHAVIYGPEGRSTCVPRNLRLGNRSAQNTRVGVARLFRSAED